MKWLLALVPGGLIVLLAWEFVRWRRRQGLSGRWLRQDGRRGSCVEIRSGLTRLTSTRPVGAPARPSQRFQRTRAWLRKPA